MEMGGVGDFLVQMIADIEAVRDAVGLGGDFGAVDPDQETLECVRDLVEAARAVVSDDFHLGGKIAGLIVDSHARRHARTHGCG